MTQTVMRPGSGAQDSDPQFTPNGGRVPRLSGDIRHLIPKTGLREYWYPMCGARRIPKKKAVRIRMLGEDLCVFKGKGEVYALTDICPHRGARLSEGDCHYDGTISCPYHGWVFDGEGRNVAVLSEGPNSIVCGKPGTEARSYPTKILKGIVWVWMGDGDPAPIEDDVPEEFFDSRSFVMFNEHIYWHTNWEVALENSMDSHVQYLHRDNMRALLGTEGVRTTPSVANAASGVRPIFTGNGFRGGAPRAPRPTTAGQAPAPAQQQSPVQEFDVYPNGWRWPKHRYRSIWAWLGGPFMNLMNIPPGPINDNELWGGGHHLPGMFRAGGGAPPPGSQPHVPWFKKLFLARGGGGLFGLYTRQTVPVDEWLTRVWYHHYTMPKNTLHKWWIVFNYYTIGRWVSEYNFSQQDMSVMLHQVYDAPEKLSGTDAEVVQWRKLVVTKHFGGRNHPFEYENPGETQPRAAAVATTNGSSNDG